MEKLPGRQKVNLEVTNSINKCFPKLLLINCRKKKIQELSRYFTSQKFSSATIVAIAFPFILKNYYGNIHCVKNVRIRSYSGPHFLVSGLNTERYSVFLRIQSECGEMQTRITPHTDTFHAMIDSLRY